MFLLILQYGFLVIFFLTAVIGLLSIVGWVPKMDEWYRKRIFTALILEVVAVILLLFKNNFTGESPAKPILNCSVENWVALDEKGGLVQPEVSVKFEETEYRETLGNEQLQAFKGLVLGLEQGSLKVKNIKGEILASFSAAELEDLGLFNVIKNEEQISSFRHHQYIKWQKGKSEDSWTYKGQYLSPFKLEIMDDKGGTKYIIRNENKGEVIFDSDHFSKDLFHVDNRMTHFFQHQGAYHLLRINEANLSGRQNAYVHVLHVLLEPKIQ
ncbi:hypothetical protein [Persicobacter sp. CCB-QB2]|uniref:hypothetical protein n=1 Tax=Persicobacter sp. CCB-QB2 TaxID=1561025 RepID=UPI0006A97327|nr:hypothetical protein [Persicobacter sp. CCB-QB2]